MRRGFLYLVAVMDWVTRKVLAWRLSNTLDVEFCLAALEEALARFGAPEIFNTDQGSQGGFKWSSQHPDEGGCDDHLNLEASVRSRDTEGAKRSDRDLIEAGLN